MAHPLSIQHLPHVGFWTVCATSRPSTAFRRILSTIASTGVQSKFGIIATVLGVQSRDGQLRLVRQSMVCLSGNVQALIPPAHLNCQEEVLTVESSDMLLLVSETWITLRNSTSLRRVSFNVGFKAFNRGSHRPPKCGACSGVNFQLMFCEVQKSSTISELSFRNNSRISCSAPTKLEPWSLHMVFGIPLCPRNRRRAAMNAVVVSSETSSRCTALVAKQTNTATYAFLSTGLRTGPDLTIMGPA